MPAKIDSVSQNLEEHLEELLASLGDGEPDMPCPPPQGTAASTRAGLPSVLRIARKARGRACHDFSTVPNAIATLGRLPRHEESIHFIMGGHFVGFDIIPAVQRLAGRPMRRLWMTTLGFSAANIAGICELIEQRLARDVLLVVSNYFKGVDTGVVEKASEQLEQCGARLTVSRCHAKIVLMEFSAREKYVLETSANLRSCKSLEQACLTRSGPLFDFHAGWIKKVAEDPCG